MKKFIVTALSLAIFPLMATSCQKVSPSLDNYEIEEVGTKEKQVIKYLTAPFSIDVFDGYITISDHESYPANAFFFKSSSAHLSYDESILFAEKYSYNTDLVDVMSICTGTAFASYTRTNTIETSVSFKISNKDELSGRYVVALTADVKEYSVTSKTNKDFKATIYGVDGYCVVNLAKL